MATNNTLNFGTGTSGQILTSNGTGVSPTFQAAPNTGGIPSIPKWINVNSSLWWSPTPYKATANLNVTADTIYAMPFLTHGSFTMTAIGITCASYSGSNSLEFALYSCSNSGSATLVSSLGTVSITGSGFKTITGLTQVVPPGWYYLCFQPSTSGSLYKYSSEANNACYVNKTDTGATISQVIYAKGSPGFPASIAASLFSSTLVTNSFIILVQGQ